LDHSIQLLLREALNATFHLQYDVIKKIWWMISCTYWVVLRVWYKRREETRKLYFSLEETYCKICYCDFEYLYFFTDTSLSFQSHYNIHTVLRRVTRYVLVWFEVLVTVVTKGSISWAIIPCSLLKVNWHFGRTCPLHL
jgi:hypothetical protein